MKALLLRLLSDIHIRNGRGFIGGKQSLSGVNEHGIDVGPGVAAIALALIRLGAVESAGGGTAEASANLRDLEAGPILDQMLNGGPSSVRSLTRS